MPDISMCSNENCPSKKKCYRFCAVPTPFRQSYAFYEPDESGRCDSFIELTEVRREQIRRAKKIKNS
jgi:hypothetical protein